MVLTQIINLIILGIGVIVLGNAFRYIRSGTVPIEIAPKYLKKSYETSKQRAPVHYWSLISMNLLVGLAISIFGLLKLFSVIGP